MTLSGDSKLIVGVFVASICIIIIGSMLVMRPTRTYQRSLLITNDTVTRGSKDAKVYLVEFSDFQCPACRTFKPLVEQILQKHGDKILFAYRHFPLPQHQYAQYAAQAFEAANEQGKGWEMYDYLFADQVNLSEDSIKDGAKTLELNVEQFEKAINLKTYKEKIDQDLADGKVLGINSTPTFFLNGKKLNLFSADDLPKAVDEAILNAE